MQDTSPRTGADCLQEERASVFQLKELFFPPPLFFFPFLLDCECVTLRSDARRIPEWQLSPFTVLLAAQLAHRSCLSWDQEGLVQLSVTASSSSPSVSFIDPLGHIKNRTTTTTKKHKQKTKQKTKMQTQQPTATKEFKGKKKNQKQAKRGKKKALAFNIKLFQDRVSFLLFWWLSF